MKLTVLALKCGQKQGTRQVGWRDAEMRREEARIDGSTPTPLRLASHHDEDFSLSYACGLLMQASLRSHYSYWAETVLAV